MYSSPKDKYPVDDGIFVLKEKYKKFKLKLRTIIYNINILLRPI